MLEVVLVLAVANVNYVKTEDVVRIVVNFDRADADVFLIEQIHAHEVVKLGFYDGIWHGFLLLSEEMQIFILKFLVDHDCIASRVNFSSDLFGLLGLPQVGKY